MKKLIALLLVLMMAALPTLSMAAEMVSITLEHGTASYGELQEYADAINKVIDMINVVYYQQGGDNYQQDGIVVLLDDVNAFDLHEATTGDAVYVASGMLGSKSLMVAKSDMYALIDGIVDDAEIADWLKGMVDAMFSTEQAGADEAAAEMDIADLLSMIDMDAMMGEVLGLLMRLEVTENTEDLGFCDPAATKISLSMTAEEISDLVNNMIAAFAGEQAAEDKLVVNEDAEFEMYLDDEGMPVCILIDTTVDGEGDDITVDFALVRVTEDSLQHYIAMLYFTEGEETANVTCSVTMVDEDTMVFTLTTGMQIADQEEVEVLSIEGSLTQVEDTTVLLSSIAIMADEGQKIGFGMNVIYTAAEDAETAGVEFTALDSDETYITINVISTDVEDFNRITGEDALNLMEMNEEDMSAFMNDVMANTMIQAISVMEVLPEEATNLILK